MSQSFLVERRAAPPTASRVALSDAARLAWGRSVFASTPESVSDRLLQGAVEISLEPGQVFYRGAQHESSAGVCLVVRGLLRLYFAAPDGRTLTMRYIGAGQLVGLMGLALDGGAVSGYPQLASEAVSGDAVRTTRVLRLSNADVLSVARSSAPVALALAREVAAQAMRDQAMLAANLFRSVQSRVALHLLDLSAPDPSGSLVVAASHREIADAIGSVREVVTRALDRLQSEGVISRRSGKLRLVHPERLRQISLG